VRYLLDLDRVLYVVANEPWQKAGTRAISPAEDRFALVVAALEGVRGLEASRIEIDRGGPSYTADTVDQLSASIRGAELFVVVGADAFETLATWERVDELVRRASFVVVNRSSPAASSKSEELPNLWPAGVREPTVTAVEIPLLEISSTDLRRRAEAGLPLEFLIPDKTIRVARERGLYALGR